MIIAIGNFIRDDAAFSGGVIPANAVLYDDDSPVFYDDDSYVLYDE